MNKLIRTNSENEDFIKLVLLLDQELAVRDGDEHGFYAQYNKLDAIKHAAVLYHNDVAVGCGAFKEFDSETAEIKRMYVLEDQRGKGLAVEILVELEKWANEEGFSKTILETGKKQPEAIRLYQKCGYQQISNYGQYVGVENSVCMEKSL